MYNLSAKNALQNGETHFATLLSIGARAPADHARPHAKIAPRVAFERCHPIFGQIMFTTSERGFLEGHGGVLERLSAALSTGLHTADCTGVPEVRTTASNCILSIRPTTWQKCGAVPRRARI